MAKEMEVIPEEIMRRCPRLGHEIRLAYCLVAGDEGLPCQGTADCWWEYFDVVEYLKENYPGDVVDRLLNPRPVGKIATIIELIEKAKKRT